MKDERRNYIVVGTFVVAMLFAFILWVGLLSGRTGATDDFHIVYDNVMGLKPGTQVVFDGFMVGTVDNIERVEIGQRDTFRVDLDVRRGWRIPEDSVATVTASGLLSAVVIEIRGGSSETLLEPGDRIPSVARADVLSAVAAVATVIQEVIDESLRPLLGTLNTAAPEIVGDVQDITDRLAATTRRIDGVLGNENVQTLEQILGNVETISAELATAAGGLATTRQSLDAVLVQVNAMLEENRGDVRQSIADLQHSLQAVSLHIDAISQNLETTSRNANEFSRQIRQNPSVLIRGRRSGSDPGDGA